MAAATETVREKTVVDGEEEARPWGECCDNTLCTLLARPICTCGDKVKKCAKTCQRCEKAGDSTGGASSRYVCRDLYFGWPGPRCSKSVAAEVRRGN